MALNGSSSRLFNLNFKKNDYFNKPEQTVLSCKEIC